MILFGFFPADPLPTRVFCRNMAKICQLHSPHKFRFSGPVIRSGYEMRNAWMERTDRRGGKKLQASNPACGTGLQHPEKHQAPNIKHGCVAGVWGGQAPLKSNKVQWYPMKFNEFGQKIKKIIFVRAARANKNRNTHAKDAKEPKPKIWNFKKGQWKRKN